METESLNPISNVKLHLANILLFFVDTLLHCGKALNFVRLGIAFELYEVVICYHLIIRLFCESTSLMSLLF